MRFETKIKHFPRPDGGLIYALIPWDSELFGFPFYELKCSETGAHNLAKHLRGWLKEICGQTEKCLAVAALAPAEIECAKILAKNAFYPVETLVEIHLPLGKFKPFIEKRFDYLKMLPAEKKDLPELVAISGSAFHTDRFHLDRNIPAARANLRYANWIRDGVNSGDHVFVMKDTRKNRAAGFVLAREIRPGVYDMSLAALAKDYHNSGAGLMLYQAMLVASREKGCKLAVAWISINNLNSLKAAERLGFTAQKAVTKFHWCNTNQGISALIPESGNVQHSTLNVQS